MREVRLGRLSSLFVMNSAEIGNQISLSLEILFFITAYVATKEGSDGKESTCYAEDLGSIPGWGRSPGEGNGNPLQYSCLEDPMDRGAWWATVYGVAKSWTWLSDKHTHTHTHTHLSRCSKGLHSIFDEPVFDKNSRNTGVDFSFSSETMATTDQLHPLDSSLDSPHCKAPRIHAIRSCWRVLLDDCHKGAPHRKLFSSTSMTSTGIFQSFALVKPFSRKYC